MNIGGADAAKFIGAVKLPKTFGGEGLLDVTKGEMKMKFLTGLAMGMLMIGRPELTISAQADAISFADGTFNDMDWSSSIIFEDGTKPGSFTANQVTTSGNPGEYRQLGQSYGGDGNIMTAHLLGWANYNPTNQGAISSLDFSFDLILFNGGDSYAVGYTGLVFQNSSYYRGGYELTPLGNDLDRWQSGYNFNLVASDFILVSGTGPAIPDFSAAGSPIQFGYIGTNGTAYSPTSTLSGIDNWSVSVNPVPKPAKSVFSWTMFLPSIIFNKHP